MATDELAEIDGIKPKKYLADGEECEAKSQTRSVRLNRLNDDILNEWK